jgi:hypothetical protein
MFEDEEVKGIILFNLLILSVPDELFQKRVVHTKLSLWPLQLNLISTFLFLITKCSNSFHVADVEEKNIVSLKIWD